MKRLILAGIFLLLFAGTAYPQVAIEIYSGPSDYKYMAVFTSSGDKLIVNYFKKKIADWDTKYTYAGVEIFVDGAKTKDTFTDNNTRE